MKSLGVYYLNVKMPRCGCVEHGLEYIAFYVQSYAHLKACSGHPLVRNGQLGAPAFVKLAYSNTMNTDALVTQGARVTAAFFVHDPLWISPWIKSISHELDIIIHVITSQLSGHFDVISNRLWRHQQNKNWASETWGRCVKIFIFIIIYGFVVSCKK